MKIMYLGLILLSGLFLSACGNKDRDEYYKACLDIADSMLTKNQFPTTIDYEKFKVQCRTGTDEIYGKK